MSAKAIAYRPEIDGLRAICVLGVILFHAHAGFSGGFVGVDVFFVISGFLISKIVLAETRAGTFSLIGFWERRIRRIFPAVLFMNASVLFACLFLYFPVDYYNLLRASRALVFGMPNFYYWNALDYFSDDNTLFPLMHTWSLGVEEQFYVFFPLIMAFAAGWRPRRVFALFVAISAVSFFVSLHQVRTGQSATAFFLLPGRAWELLAGCLLTLANPLERLSPARREIFSIAGLGGILGCMLAYDEKMSFPGLNALPPVLAACLFIAANAPEITRSGRFLARPGFVTLGKMSFSLYLWHWPLITFATLLFPDSRVVITAFAALSFPIAWFSWQYVEEPFRRKQLFVSRRAVFRFFVTTNACLLAWVFAGSRTNGFHQRTWALPGPVQALYRTYQDDFTLAPVASGDQIDFLAGRTGMIGADARGGPRFFLWGDSHAIAVSHTFHEVARDLGVSGLFAYSLGLDVVPFENAETDRFAAHPANTADINARILEKLEASGIRNIVLVSRWSRHLDKPGGQEDLRRFLRFVREKAPDTTVYVFQEVPRQRYLRRVFYYQFFLNEVVGWPFTFRPTGRDDYAPIGRPFATALDGIDDPKIVKIECLDRFFDSEGHLEHRDGTRNLYIDEDHLSRHGSQQLMRPAIESVLGRIAGTDATPPYVTPRTDPRIAESEPTDTTRRPSDRGSAVNSLSSSHGAVRGN